MEEGVAGLVRVAWTWALLAYDCLLQGCELCPRQASVRDDAGCEALEDFGAEEDAVAVWVRVRTVMWSGREKSPYDMLQRVSIASSTRAGCEQRVGSTNAKRLLYWGIWALGVLCESWLVFKEIHTAVSMD